MCGEVGERGAGGGGGGRYAHITKQAGEAPLFTRKVFTILALATTDMAGRSFVVFTYSPSKTSVCVRVCVCVCVCECVCVRERERD